MQNYPISPHPLDQDPVVQIRVCIVCMEDEFALDPLPIKNQRIILSTVAFQTSEQACRSMKVIRFMQEPREM